jgi:hypothetical protein
MTLIPLVISAVSLILSITVAWLTLFRRGTLGMTQPMLVGFLHEGAQAKIFYRAMLYATGKRGHIVEALYLRASVIRLNPAIDDRVKTGHRGVAEDVIVLPCRHVALQGG